jgi:hypothetical protein
MQTPTNGSTSTVALCIDSEGQHGGGSRSHPRGDVGGVRRVAPPAFVLTDRVDDPVLGAHEDEGCGSQLPLAQAGLLRRLRQNGSRVVGHRDQLHLLLSTGRPRDQVGKPASSSR